MPPLFYPSFQALSLADVIFEEIADRVSGFIGRLGAGWYWRLAGGTLATFRLDCSVTEERWDVIRAQATNPRAGLFNSADFPFALYATTLSSPPYIHDLQGAAEWANRLYFNMGVLIAEAVQWLQMLQAAIISPHVTPPASFPYLNSLEREIVRYALEALDGRFDQAKLHAAFGDRISRRRLSRLAQDWESLGLLTPRPRRVTYALRLLIETEK
ncbi:MAG TPA: hypothetical protein EYH30_08600 [Anaerolineales bacterium]|nr:hypothetical protein [Anaerolineae bacterium]HIQ02171.1 hypothetical protein [Anaerolineales bacterium]